MSTTLQMLAEHSAEGRAFWIMCASREAELREAMAAGADVVFLPYVVDMHSVVCGYYTREGAATKLESLLYPLSRDRRFVVEDGYGDSENGDRRGYQEQLYRVITAALRLDAGDRDLGDMGGYTWMVTSSLP